MNQEYFDKVTELEEMNASEQYVLGWQEGYQGGLKLKNNASLMLMKLVMKMVKTITSIALISTKAKLSFSD